MSFLEHKPSLTGNYSFCRYMYGGTVNVTKGNIFLFQISVFWRYFS